MTDISVNIAPKEAVKVNFLGIGPKGDKGEDSTVPGPKGDEGDKGDMGNTGPTGPKGDTGNKGVNWRGEWSGTTAYIIDDAVGSSGSSYICILGHTNHQPPNPTYWELLVTGDEDADTVDGKHALAFADADHAHPESDVTNLVTDLAGKEPALGNPGTDGFVLSSTTAGVRSWIAGGGNMVYTTAASHTHSGGGAYETAINLSGKGQIQVFASLSADPSAKKYHTFKITVDGTVVITDLFTEYASYSTPLCSLGIWNFDTSFKLAHKSDAGTAIVKAAYCIV